MFYKISINRNQLAKSRTYTHTSGAFWYEKSSRTLLIATFSPSDQNKIGNKITLRTYFLRMNEKTSYASNASYALPRLNLPPPDLLPLFHVDIDDLNDGNDTWDTIKNDWLNSTIILIKLYDEPYCIYLKQESNNIHKEIHIYHLDKLGRCVQFIKTLHIPSTAQDDETSHDIARCPYSVTSLDNILCVHFKKKISFLYDIANSSSDPIFQGEFICECDDFNQK